MGKVMKIVLGSIIGLVLLWGISFGLRSLGIWEYSKLAPKMENARREMFENSQPFVESKRQALIKYYNEWRKEDESGKEALRQIVVLEFASFDRTKYFTDEQEKLYQEMTK